MTDSIDTSEREAEEPRGPITLPVREMREEPLPHQPADPLRAALQLALEATPEQLPAALRALAEQPAVAAAMARGAVPQGWQEALKLKMEWSAWDGTLQLGDALANIDEVARQFPAAPTPEATQPTQAEAPSLRRAAESLIDAYRKKYQRDTGSFRKDAPLWAEATALRAALATQQAGQGEAVPQGWKLVPVEPTWDMKMVASSNYREPRDGHYTARMECAADAYRAMLSAAPSPEATQQAGQGEALSEDEITLLLADKIGFGDSDLQWCNRSDLVSVIRAVEARYSTTPPAPQQPEALAQQERTPKDFAIEHAEYLAKDGDRLIDAVNDLARAEQEREDGQANDSDVDAAREAVNEAMRALRSGVFEFRKRRDRVTPKASEQVERRRWLCLTCKSDTPGRHGLMDDRVTPCPKSTEPRFGPYDDEDDTSHLMGGAE